MADASTTANLPQAGRYRVLARTRDWVAPSGAPGAPGSFQIVVAGRALNTIFGRERAEWHWHSGGAIDLPAGPVTLALRDLTGFNGRCDAILLTSDAGFIPPDGGEELASLRQRLLALPSTPEDAGEYDLVDEFGPAGHWNLHDAKLAPVLPRSRAVNDTASIPWNAGV